MMPIDVNSSKYINFKVEKNDKDPKVKVGDHIRITKYKNIAKGYTSNWSEELFVIRNAQETFRWTYVPSDLNCEQIVRTFYG